MGFRDRVKKIVTKKTSPTGSGNQNDAVKLSDAQQSQANEITQWPKAQVEDTPIRDVQQDQESETAQRPKVRIEDTSIRELWNVAYEKLREENSALIAEYEKTLQCSPAAGSNMKDQLRIILEKKMNEVNAKASKFGKTEAPATEVVSKIMGLANDYVRSAARANSYTSIAWAGVSFILPVSQITRHLTLHFILTYKIAFDQPISTKSFFGKSNR